jgi:hypothetical protein
VAKTETQRAADRARVRRNRRIERWQQKGLCPECVKLLDADHERKQLSRRNISAVRK